MNKLLIILLLCGIQVLNATTCNNPLQPIFGFSNQTTAAIVPNVTTCKSLQNQESCCSADDFKSIQGKIDNFITNLTGAVASRDISLTNIRLRVLPGLVGAMQRLVLVIKKLSNGDNSTTSLQSVFDRIASLGNMSNVTNSTSNYTDIMNTISGLDKLHSKVPQLKNDFNAYQKSRTKCVLQMLKLQAATLCLACDPNYSSKGLAADGNISFSNGIKTRLVNACYDYFSGTEEHSRLMDMQAKSSLITDLGSVMEKISNGDQTGITDLLNLIKKLSTITPPTKDSEKPARMPSSCKQSDCSFIWSQVYSAGKINTGILANGGLLTSTLSSSSRLLEEENEDNGRILQSSWTFDNDEASVNIAFQDDPGNSNSMTASTGLIRGSIISIAVLLISFIF